MEKIKDADTNPEVSYDFDDESESKSRFSWPE